MVFLIDPVVPGAPALPSTPMLWVESAIKNPARSGAREYSVGRSIATHNAPCFSLAGVVWLPEGT